MSFENYVLFESEVRGFAKKFESLKSSIQKTLESINKFKENKDIIESGNMEVIRQFNKVGETLEDALREIDVLVDIASEKKDEPVKDVNKKKMADYLIKETK